MLPWKEADPARTRILAFITVAGAQGQVPRRCGSRNNSNIENLLFGSLLQHPTPQEEWQ